MSPERISPERRNPAPGQEQPDVQPARRIPRILSIAGTDPTGGAGIQADLKSIAATGGYGMAVVTALVAQNTQGVRSVHTPPVDFLREQLDAVSDDVEIDAVKIGMLGTAEVTGTVESWLTAAEPPVVVLDPVMVATSGDRLLDGGAEAALRRLLHRVDLVTPNLPELAVLVQEPVAASWDEALAQGQRLSAAYGVKVLVKGGHLAGRDSPDALVDAAAANPVLARITTERVETENTHGTGCSLSSAMATYYVRLGGWDKALAAAKTWLQEALEHADELAVGTGHGPVHHFHGVWERGLSETAPAMPEELPGAVEAAGPLTAALWRQTADLRADIDELDFVRALGSGSLDRESFEFYLAQDALYLRDYSRALARASELAPTVHEQAFWAKSAHGALAAELELHKGRLPAATAAGQQVLPGSVTRGYLRHLLGSRTSSPAGDSEYGRLVGAVLPCFWIYADVGARLLKHHRPDHPYADWLATYGDPGFTRDTREAVHILEAVLERSGDETRAVIHRAFSESTRWEHAFFAAGSRELQENR